MKRHVALGLLLALLAAAAACVAALGLLDPGEPLPTVDGPEDPGLAARLTGWVVWAEDDAGDIRWLELPSQARGRLELGRGVSVLLGVDPRRRLLYIDSEDGISRLRRAPLDGGERETLHAFEVQLGSARADPELRWLIHDRGEVLHVLEITPEHGAAASRATQVDDWTSDRACWLDPGSLLVYEAFVPVWDRDDPGTRYRDVLAVLDLASGEERTVAREGRKLAAVDPTPGEILVTSGDPQRGDLRLQRFDVGWGLIDDEVRVPGLLLGILGVAPDGLVVYEGLPTTGTEQELLGWGLTWPRARWTLKVADPRTGAFQTLVPSFERHYGYPEPIASLLRPR